jgi:predicted TIM-barrel fold metal-dependent hydrolase
LSFDAWCYHPQLPQVRDLADAFPDTTIILNHMGGPVAVGPYRRDEAFSDWENSLRSLAVRENVHVKIGGIGMRWSGFDFIDRPLPPTSDDLANAWRPYVETCIDAFGPHRAMFESNFPPDKGGCSARVLWNTFKRLTASLSSGERAALFAGTASRVYRLQTELA